VKQVDKIFIKELQDMAKKMFDNLVKADVDVANRIMVVDMAMHADGEAHLLEQGSKNLDIWGINLHPAKYGSSEFIEFDSVINYKQDNRSRDVDDEAVRAQITKIVEGIVHE